MVNLGRKADRRRLERVIDRKQNGEVKDTSAVRAIRRADDHSLPSKHVITLRASRAICRRICLEIGQFASDTAEGHSVQGDLAHAAQLQGQLLHSAHSNVRQILETVETVLLYPAPK